MKFSIIIPTQDRPELAALATSYALNQNYKDIELVISDNSTTLELKEKNKLNLEPYIQTNKLLYVSPPKILSAPEHFEYALQFATGDYVLFLTDKMILLPHTLDIVVESIKKTDAEIVNWTFHTFITNDCSNPATSGQITINFSPPSFDYDEYDSLQLLEYKAKGSVLRQNETIEDYVKGKVCFGCYSKDLISKIIRKSGALYGGATHDYSAMIQALCLVKKGILLKEPGIIFISLPPDKSLGSLTHFHSSAARKYYDVFPDPELILNALFIPGLYASQHNMVAHDYIKYLTLYKKRDLFGDKFWARSICDDLCLPDKVWVDQEEYNSQIRLLFQKVSYKQKIFLYFYKSRKTIEYYKNIITRKIKLSIKSMISSLGPLGNFLFDLRKSVVQESSLAQGSLPQTLSLEKVVWMITERYQ